MIRDSILGQLNLTFAISWIGELHSDVKTLDRLFWSVWSKLKPNPLVKLNPAQCWIITVARQREILYFWKFTLLYLIFSSFLTWSNFVSNLINVLNGLVLVIGGWEFLSQKATKGTMYLVIKWQFLELCCVNHVKWIISLTCHVFSWQFWLHRHQIIRFLEHCCWINYTTVCLSNQATGPMSMPSTLWRWRWWWRCQWR